MSFLKAFAEQNGVELLKAKSPRSTASFRERLIDAADKQIQKLDEVGANGSLDYNFKETKKRWWWASSAVDGKRPVKMYLDNKIVGEAEDALAVDDNWAAVRKIIEGLKEQITSTSDNYWDKEIKRRANVKKHKKKESQGD